jgi:hypothetical protein
VVVLHHTELVVTELKMLAEQKLTVSAEVQDLTA